MGPSSTVNLHPQFESFAWQHHQSYKLTLPHPICFHFSPRLQFNPEVDQNLDLLCLVRYLQESFDLKSKDQKWVLHVIELVLYTLGAKVIGLLVAKLLWLVDQFNSNWNSFFVKEDSYHLFYQYCAFYQRNYLTS